MIADNIWPDVKDWEYACHLKRCPSRSAGSVDYSARRRRVRELLGDCHDLTPLSDHEQALMAGNTSGNGIAGGLLMASVQFSLRTASLFAGDDLAGLFRIVNRQIYASSSAELYATVFYGIFDSETLALRYVNAGHNPPLILRRDGSFEWLELGEAPVGMFPDSRYCERLVRLDRGDALVLYTDGVTEAENQAGSEWGVDGLLKAAKSRRPQNAEELARHIFDAMDNFSCGSLSDDATVAVLKVP